MDVNIRSIDWGSVYVASEWIIRVAALIVVPQRRPPSAARAWLLLIFFLPWPGLVFYTLIGRAYLPRRRLDVQKQIYETIRRIEPRALSGEAVTAPAVSPELLPALRLAEQLSEFPVVGGNRFELLPVYDAAIDRIIADVDAAQRQVHMLFYIFEDDETGARVAAALKRALQRGVVVRVLMDAIGSRGGLKGLAPGLRTAGAEVISVMPLRLWGPNAARFDLRNHRKIVVVDGRFGYFGSQNIVSATRQPRHGQRGNAGACHRADRAPPARRIARRSLSRNRQFAAGIRQAGPCRTLWKVKVDWRRSSLAGRATTKEPPRR